MSLLMLAEVHAHPIIHWFDVVSGIIVAIIALIILVEMILMIPDFIKTIKIHLM